MANAVRVPLQTSAQVGGVPCPKKMTPNGGGSATFTCTGHEMPWARSVTTTICGPPQAVVHVAVVGPPLNQLYAKLPLPPEARTVTVPSHSPRQLTPKVL